MTVFEKRVLRRTFGPTREDVTDDCIKRSFTIFATFSWRKSP
jgi:hypothetical protein